jgi:hypothetical protein
MELFSSALAIYINTQKKYGTSSVELIWDLEKHER